MTTATLLLFRLKRIRRRLLSAVDPYEILCLQRQAFRYAARVCDLSHGDPRVRDRMTLLLNDLIALVVARRVVATRQ